MQLSINTLQDLSNIDVNAVDIKNVDGFSAYDTNDCTEKKSRIIEYLKATKNPYISKSGSILVKVEYSNTSTMLEDILLLLLLDKKDK